MITIKSTKTKPIRKIWHHNGLYSIVEMKNNIIKVLYTTEHLDHALERINWNKEYL